MTFNNTTPINNLYPVANATTSSNPFVYAFASRDPTANDLEYPIQKWWLNTSTNVFWFLKNFVSANGTVSANWIQASSGQNPIVEIGVDASAAPGTNPVLPTNLGLITVTGGQVASGTTANVIQTDSLAANTFTIQIQRSQAVSSSTVGDNGVSHFNSEDFTVDANGFVSLAGGTVVEGVEVDTFTTPGTNPVLPNASGIITVTGGQVAAGTTANAIQTDSLAANTYAIQVQRSRAAAISTVGDNGICHFNSADFTVDANGFVTSTLGGAFQFKNQVFTSSGTYTPTTGMVYCQIICIGGGGGGGGAVATGSGQVSVGGGGGAGEYAVGAFSASTIGASQTVTIGSGGAGGAGTNGSGGSTSSVGSLISAAGGSGAAASTANSGTQTALEGLGGTGGAGGDYRAAGSNGLTGVSTTTGGFSWGGTGGSSKIGSGGVATIVALNQSGSGRAASNYGSGGGGAANGSSMPASSGGNNGSAGIVVIQEYIFT